MSQLSLEHQLALLPPDEQAAILDGVDHEALAYDWRYFGRPDQIFDPADDFAVALAMAGRGWGKSLAGAQWIRAMDAAWRTLGRDTEHMRFALLGRTSADVRDVMLEGQSGLLNVFPPSQRHRVIWTPSRRRVELPNGAVGLCFSAEEPDQLRGPAFHIGWCDELAAFKQMRTDDAQNATAWENLRIAVRIGEQPQILATTTPKRVPVLRQLMSEAGNPDSKILIRRGKTMDNVKLSRAYLNVLTGLYGGTRLGAQELEGEMLDDVVGAMTSEKIIDQYRVPKLPTNLPYLRVIGVDPSVAERPHDECGMVVVYGTRTWPILRRHAFVVDDLSMQASPAVWSDVLVKAANEHQAVIVVEINQGANLVKHLVIQAAHRAGLPVPPIREVWASKSKSVRAEVVGAAYDKGRIHHVNVHADYESQATSWVAGEAGYSPDRMDAAVHGLASVLFPDALVHGSPGSGVLHTATGAQLPYRGLAARRAG